MLTPVVSAKRRVSWRPNSSQTDAALRSMPGCGVRRAMENAGKGNNGSVENVGKGRRRKRQKIEGEN